MQCTDLEMINASCDSSNLTSIQSRLSLKRNGHKRSQSYILMGRPPAPCFCAGCKALLFHDAITNRHVISHPAQPSILPSYDHTPNETRTAIWLTVYRYLSSFHHMSTTQASTALHILSYRNLEQECTCSHCAAVVQKAEK